MSCLPCFGAPPEAGARDAAHADSYVERVKLSTGREVRVRVRPGDTPRVVRRKVEAEFGRQPDVAVRGALVRAHIVAKWQRWWLPVGEDVPLEALAGAPIKFAEITDKLDQVKQFRDVHWVASNVVHFAL